MGTLSYDKDTESLMKKEIYDIWMKLDKAIDDKIKENEERMKWHADFKPWQFWKWKKLKAM